MGGMPAMPPQNSGEHIRHAYLVVKRNSKVMSSTPSRLLSIFIW